MRKWRVYVSRYRKLECRMIHDEQIQKQVLFFVTLLPHLCVFFIVMLPRCNMPFTFPCTRSRSTQFLSAKFLCFGFASTNHVARNHIDRNVYGPHCVKTPYGSAVNNPKAAMITAFLHVANRKNEQRGTGYCVLNGQMEQSIVDRIDRSNRKIKVAQFER